MMSHNCDSIEMSDESDNEGFVRESKEPIFLRRRTYDMKTLAKLRWVFKSSPLIGGISTCSAEAKHWLAQGIHRSVSIWKPFSVAHNIRYPHLCRKEGQLLSGKKKGKGFNNMFRRGNFDRHILETKSKTWDYHRVSFVETKFREKNVTLRCFCHIYFLVISLPWKHFTIFKYIWVYSVGIYFTFKHCGIRTKSHQFCKN